MNSLRMACCLLVAVTIKALPSFAAQEPSAAREVGIAYSLWLDADTWRQAWGSAELGRYDSRDRRIIRKHAEWLDDAGVDFIWLDWSNQISYDPAKIWHGGKQDLIEDATAILFDEYAKLDRRPKISIFLGVTGAPEAVRDGRLSKKADQVYAMYAGNPKYKALCQYYLGKPLLVVYVNTPTPWPNGLPDWNDDRFTVRWMTGFVTEQSSLLSKDGDRLSKHGYWSWEDRGRQSYAAHEGRPESVVVTAATRAQAVVGHPHYIPARGREGGQTFRDQWTRARELDPRFVMVISWNEWVKSEQPSAEVSKDLEPSQEQGRFYLKLLKDEIRRYKAAEPQHTDGALRRH